MRVCCRCLVAMLLICCALCASRASADGAGLPNTATPRLVVVNTVSEPTETITCSYVATKPVVETLTHVEDGRTVATQKVHLVCEQRLMTFSLLKSSYHDAQGKRLSREEFVSRVRAGDVILVSADNKPVDQAYLRVFKGEMLVLVPAETESLGRTTPNRALKPAGRLVAPAPLMPAPMPAPAPAPAMP
jgi:hypothetical protein